METSSNKSKEQKKDLVSSIKEKLETSSYLTSIFEVPEKLRSANKLGNVYTPDTVSIGHFHHGKETLKSMEKNKWRYLYTLLSRKPTLESNLSKCVQALREIEQTARHFYAKAEELPKSPDEFVEMMLVDGCFIIELFFKYSIKGLRRRGDPIFTTRGLLSNIRCNLILLENQIPLLILQSLFEVVPNPIKGTQTLSFSDLAFRFFKKMLPQDSLILSERFSQDGNHLLDLIHQFYLPTYTREPSKEPEYPIDPDLRRDNVQCATKLLKDGIKFMMFTAKSLLDISFDDGVFEIPPLKIHKYTEVLFSNLIALEHHNEVQQFTSYALLMEYFVHCESDVKLFRHLTILTNKTEEEEKGKEEKGKEKKGKEQKKKELKDILDLFRRLSKKVDVKEFYYAGLVEEVKKYKESRRSWMQTLKSTCLKVPTSK